MGNRKFGLTTYVIVGISLVALYFVGKTVTPPPPAPPVEVKSAVAQTPTPPSESKRKFEEEKATRQTQQRAQQMHDMAAKMKNHPQPNSKAFNPTSIDTDATYWQDKTVKEGAVGEKEMAAKVAAATAKVPPPAPPHAVKSPPMAMPQ